MRLGGLWAVALLALPGCYSFSTLGRARTLEKGHFEVFAAPEALIIASASGAAVRPIAEAGVRYGVTDAVEVDGRLTMLGVTLGPRIQLRRSPSPRSGWDVAVAPAIAYTHPDKLAFEAPLLFGWNLGEHQLVVAPRLVYQMRLGVPGQNGPVSFVDAGLSLGLALRLTPGVSLLPELAGLAEIYAEPGFSSNLARAAGLQAALGFLFDL